MYDLHVTNANYHLFIIVIVSFLSRSYSRQNRQLTVHHSLILGRLCLIPASTGCLTYFNLLTFLFAVVHVVISCAHISELFCVVLCTEAVHSHKHT